MEPNFVGLPQGKEKAPNTVMGSGTPAYPFSPPGGKKTTQPGPWQAQFLCTWPVGCPPN